LAVSKVFQVKSKILIYGAALKFRFLSRIYFVDFYKQVHAFGGSFLYFVNGRYNRFNATFTWPIICRVHLSTAHIQI